MGFGYNFKNFGLILVFLDFFHFLVFVYHMPMRMALIADWLVTYGGAEHVLRELLQIFPGAPLFTTVAKYPALGPLRDVDIRTSRLQPWYRLLKQHQPLLPWMPSAIEQLDLRDFDVVISSSHAVAKGIVPSSRTLHLCYCHTPMRYAWEMEEQYLHDFRVPHFLRPMIRRRLRDLRRWDLATAQRVDHFIANSSTTQERIERTYARESVVIPPPVDDRFFEQVQTQDSRLKTQDYFLAVGRFVPYKRFDLLIEAANALQLPLWIAGRGQEEARLRRLTGPTVRFLGFVPDAELPALYANATALLFPQYEDAGIVLLESLASGTPVIAFRAGGAMDAVKENVNGLFFDEQTLPALTDALERFLGKQFNRAAIRTDAKRFSREAFREAIQSTVKNTWEKFRYARSQ